MGAPPAVSTMMGRPVGANKRWRSSPTSRQLRESVRPSDDAVERERSPSCVSACMCTSANFFVLGVSLSPSFYYRAARTQSSACPAGSLSSSQDSASGVLACFPARQFEPAGSPVLGSSSTSTPRHQAGSKLPPGANRLSSLSSRLQMAGAGERPPPAGS